VLGIYLTRYGVVAAIGFLCMCAPLDVAKNQLDFVAIDDGMKYERVCDASASQLLGLLENNPSDPDFVPPSKFSLFRDASGSVLLINGIGSNCAAKFSSERDRIAIRRLELAEGGLVNGPNTPFELDREAAIHQLYLECENDGQEASTVAPLRSLELSSPCQEIVHRSITMRLLLRGASVHVLVIIGAKVFIWRVE
jgi:hypothetical protein